MGEPVLSGLMPPPGMPRPERSVHPGVCGDSIVRFTLRAEPESDVLPLQLNEEKAVVQGGQGTGEVVSGPSRDDGSLSGLIEVKLERCVRSQTPGPHDSQIGPPRGSIVAASGNRRSTSVGSVRTRKTSSGAGRDLVVDRDGTSAFVRMLSHVLNGSWGLLCRRRPTLDVSPVRPGTTVHLLWSRHSGPTRFATLLASASVRALWTSGFLKRTAVSRDIVGSFLPPSSARALNSVTSETVRAATAAR